MSVENSIDFNYLNKIVAQSNRANEPREQKAPTKIVVNLKNRKAKVKTDDAQDNLTKKEISEDKLA